MEQKEPYTEPGTGAEAGAGVAVAVAVAGGELNYKCKHNAPWNSNDYGIGRMDATAL